MASVYLGYRADVDRQVAIKVLPPHPGLNDESKQRFRLEARTIANLQHPHILPLYDYGATEDGILYLVMPYVSGGSLDIALRSGPLPIEKAVRIVREISSALDYAHRQGVIHRDIKPGNILLDGEGNALLGDFGIVKQTDSGADLTGTSIVGTPSYMPPEQAQGQPLTAQADLYSFAVVTYEILSGNPPFSSDNMMNLLLKHLSDPVPDITDSAPSLPAALNDVMKKALAKAPQDRFSDARAFSAAIAEATTQTVNPDTVPTLQQKPVRAEETLPLPVTLPQPETIATPIPPQTIVIPPSQGAGNLPLFIVIGLVALIAIAALVLVLTNTQDSGTPQTPTAPTTVARVNAQPVFGRASFSSSDDSMMGDSINLRMEGIAAPASGMSYAAALVNTTTGERLPLGRLTVDALGSGALGYTDSEGRFLSTLYNALIISLEATATPTFEDVRYSALLPVEINTLMREFFVESADAFRDRSLLATAELEVRFATQHAGLAARARNIGARHTHSEHTLNILLGGRQDFDGNGRSENPGTGLGLVPMLDHMDRIIGMVADMPDAPSSVQIESELVRVCIQNVRLWVDEIVAHEQAMLLSDSLEASEADAIASSELMERLQPGIDANENGIVEPFEGECGLEQVKTFGLVIASFDVVEAPLPADVTVSGE